MEHRLNIYQITWIALFVLMLSPGPGISQSIDPSLFNSMQWRNIGPHRGGRTVGAVGVPQQPNVFYIAATNGGVWKTNDYGRTWKPVFDDQPTGSIGDVAVAPSNPEVVYVASGEGIQRPDLSVGDGIYKSTDAGKTWNHLGLREGQQIGGLAVDPKNENRVFAAVLGHPYGPNTERGVYRSTDGGKNWERVLYKDENTGAVQVAIDPSNPDIVFADLWAGRQGPWENGQWNGEGSGLFKSTDGGTTWKQLTKGLPTPKEGLSRIGFCIAPSNGSRLYATVEAGEQGGIYRSDDGGESWVKMNSDERFWGRGDDFAEVKVDPKNADIVYTADVVVWKSTDGAKTWNAYRGAPGGDDYHRIWINPDNTDILLIACDQGGIITVNGGQSFSSWYNQPTAQFYHVSTDNAFPYNVYGAQQDNSSIRIASRTGDFTIGIRDWYPVAGGEAGYIVPDPTNPDITFGGEYDGQLTTYNKKTGQYRAVSPDPELHQGAGAEDYKYRFAWTYPIAFSPHNPKMIYAGSNYVLRSTDGGQNWQAISPDLSRHDPKTLKPSGGPITLDNTGAEVYADVFAFAESPLKQGVLWAGSDDGLVHVSVDDGKNWADVTPRGLPEWAMISYVEPSHFDAATCYLSATRYKSDDNRPYVFKTTDYGRNWIQITNGLPENTYNRCIREDPNRRGLLYCGLETGIYVSFDDGAHWQSLQLNLPNTPVHDIQIQMREKDLVIATHGRSFWVLDDITPLYQLSDEVARSSAWLYKPRHAYRTPGGYIEDPTVQEGQNAPNGVIIRYYLNSKPDREVKLKFFSPAGDSIIAYSNLKDNKGEPVKISHDYYESKAKRPGLLAIDSGMNAFVWDLRYPAAKGDTSATFEGSLEGPLAVPGTYQVRLCLGDSVVQTQSFEVFNDPRSNFTTADLTEQFELAQQVHGKLNEVGKANRQIRSVRAQLNGFLESFEDSIQSAPFRKSARPIVDSLTAIEDVLHNSKIVAGEDNLRFPMRLEEKLSALNAAVIGADAKPTTAMHDSYQSLAGRIDVQLKKLKDILDNKIPAFNEMAKTKQKAVIDIKAKE